MQVSNDIFFENLLEELLVSGYGLIYVKGYSMVPFLANEKDRVQLRRFDSSTEELKKGQVALFKFRGRYILHRVVGTIDKGGKKLYKFRGDGNCSGVEWAAPENVYAVMVKRITPSGKEWSCDSLSWKLRGTMAPNLYCQACALGCNQASALPLPGYSSEAPEGFFDAGVILQLVADIALSTPIVVNAFTPSITFSLIFGINSNSSGLSFPSTKSI